MKLREVWPSLRATWRVCRLSSAVLKRSAEKPLPVIVTLTSIPSRLRTLHLTIRSLLAQSTKPERIVLWLHRDLEHSLPQSLVELQGEVFQIHYVDLTCSHRKLIHSLTAFPDRVLVTCDDDEIYEETWLERLYRDHLQFPGDVIAHECRRIAYGADGAPLPYRKWRTLTQAGAAGMDLLPIGYGGVLYPPGALMPEATDVDLFMRLAPKADDLWFKAMSFRKGTRVRRSRDPLPKPVGIIGSQWVSLQKTNVHEDANRLQWLAICEHFGIELEPRPAQRKAGPLLMLWLYFSSCWRLS